MPSAAAPWGLTLTTRMPSATSPPLFIYFGGSRSDFLMREPLETVADVITLAASWPGLSATPRLFHDVAPATHGQSRHASILSSSKDLMPTFSPTSRDLGLKMPPPTPSLPPISHAYRMVAMIGALSTPLMPAAIAMPPSGRTSMVLLAPMGRRLRRDDTAWLPPISLNIIRSSSERRYFLFLRHDDISMRT